MASFDDDSYATGNINNDDLEEIQPPPPPYDNDGYDSGIASQPYDFDLPSATADDHAPHPPIYAADDFASAGDHHIHNNLHSPETYGFGSAPNPDYSFEPTVPQSDGTGKPYDIGADTDGLFTASEGPLLPDPTEMREQGAAFREWRRQNAIYLEEKEHREKEMRTQIFNEAEEFKRAFYEKRKINCETNKAHNREREKLYLTNQEKFHKEADKQYWKAIAEIIPREVANIEKRGRKKDDERKPSVTVIQGPKPGKPTDLARMRQLILKLKQKPPSHMLPPPPPPAKDDKDAKDAKDEKNAAPAAAEEGKDDKDGKGTLKAAAAAAAEDAAAKPASPTKNANPAAADKPVSPSKNAVATDGFTATAKQEGPAATDEKQVAETESATTA
ncbi:clathrin light chain 2-like [Diospyros lotus]|uniref:clathrin light chain 2-like n=1 Tax=Diospyros lotus TaxID=55363 RepID=UPI00224D0D88|nr:clathrin light chain 2-like [Diospyros lotus]